MKPGSSAKTLPGIPAVALHALERMGDPDLSTRELASLLRNDPAIVARLLSVANSAACGLSRKVSSVEQVVVLLGTPAVISLVVSIALAPRDIRPHLRRHYQRVWTDCVMMGTSAELLAQNVCGLHELPFEPADFFTCGLLADVGRLAMLRDPEIDYADVMDRADLERADLIGVESAELQQTHPETSAALIKEWGAPEFVQRAVRDHHRDLTDLEHAGYEDARLISGLIFSAILVEYLNNPSRRDLFEKLHKVGNDRFQMSAEEIEDHIGAVLDRISEATELFAIQPTELEAVRERFLIGLEAAMMAAIEDRARARTAVVLERSNVDLHDRLVELADQVSHDSLTGLYTRDYFEVRLKQRLAGGAETPGLLFVDIDHFKLVNDTHGHVAGDSLLKHLAHLLTCGLRPTDLAARFGGDEFVILVSDTNREQLCLVAERMQRRIDEATFEYEGKPLQASVSVGAILCSPSNRAGSVTELIMAADNAMYAAKSAGRNRVCLAGSEECGAETSESAVSFDGLRPTNIVPHSTEPTDAHA